MTNKTQNYQTRAQHLMECIRAFNSIINQGINFRFDRFVEATALRLKIIKDIEILESEIRR